MASTMQLGASRSAFTGKLIAFRSTPVAPVSMRTSVVSVEAGRRCDLTGKKRNKANVVTFSNKHNRKWQYPNLQQKKVYWPEGQRWVKLRICTKAIKTIEKKGLDAMAKEAGIDLWKLPFEDARPERLAYLEANKGVVPVGKDRKAMKNADKLAASTKQPMKAMYEPGGRIVWVRPGAEEAVAADTSVAMANKGLAGAILP